MNAREQQTYRYLLKRKQSSGLNAAQQQMFDNLSAKLAPATAQSKPDDVAAKAKAAAEQAK